MDHVLSMDLQDILIVHVCLDTQVFAVKVSKTLQRRTYQNDSYRQKDLYSLKLFITKSTVIGNSIICMCYLVYLEFDKFMSTFSCFV